MRSRGKGLSSPPSFSLPDETDEEIRRTMSGLLAFVSVGADWLGLYPEILDDSAVAAATAVARAAPTKAAARMVDCSRCARVPCL